MPREKQKLDRRVLVMSAILVVILGGGIAALAYLLAQNKTVYIDKAQIEAPTVTLSPSSPGILQNISVSVGDTIPANTVVATVGTELIKSTQGGLVITVNNNIGKIINPGDPVVVVIDPTQLRVVGQVQEDKGLVDIIPGDRATFTVDAFGGKQFSGIVDEVSPTAESGDVVFSVSDKRQEQNFDVKVRYDLSAYPELRNGMSAKVWVYKQ